MKFISWVWCLGLASGVLLQPAQAQDGSAIYTARCAACHETPLLMPRVRRRRAVCWPTCPPTRSTTR